MRFILRRLGPWAWVVMVIQAALVTRRHWQSASPDDRARLRELVKGSGGRPKNLTPAERSEVLELTRRMRPGKLIRDLVMGVIRPGRRARGA